MKSIFARWVLVLFAITLSGFCWYFSLGLSGNFFYLLWIAPIPVLVISLNTTPKLAFVAAFFAYLLGKLSWFSYLVSVATIIPAIIFTITLSLIFALIVIVTRYAVTKIKSWYTIFAFPVFFTSFENLLIKFSPDGIAGSIACSQSNFLSFIQIASVTGILGITFMVSFFPSVIALSWYYRKENDKLSYIISAAAITMVPVFLFGVIRISNGPNRETVKVGLVVLDEQFHYITQHPDFEKEKLTTEYYVKQISMLAGKGAKLVVLPERAININPETADTIVSMLKATAKQNHVFIVTGYTNFITDKERNSSLVIDANGNVLVDYNKVHLVKGLEDQFTPGGKLGLFKFDDVESGTAICKDLDFPDYIKKYGNANVGFLNIPAWDFAVDDWLHSRMAILRSVENGFSEVRTARQGRLTVSDYYGRVTNEANCSDGKAATLIGVVSKQKINTIYTRLGDRFGVVNLIAAICLIFIVAKNRKKRF